MRQLSRRRIQIAHGFKSLDLRHVRHLLGESPNPSQQVNFQKLRLHAKEPLQLLDIILLGCTARPLGQNHHEPQFGSERILRHMRGTLRNNPLALKSFSYLKRRTLKQEPFACYKHRFPGRNGKLARANEQTCKLSHRRFYAHAFGSTCEPVPCPRRIICAFSHAII